MPIKQKIKTFIRDNALIPEEKNWKGLVALSGGADSVCLLLVCRQLGFNIEAVHCNFHLRGEESDRDELFCEKLCEREGIPFHRVHFDTTTYASLHKVSIEMAARELRYGYFEQLRKSIDANDILVAHHRDDSVETLLMNLFRGTGIHGLQGIKPRNGHIIRPLLCIGRQDIESWLALQKQSFVTDSTNLEDDALRNKIRLNVIPLLKTINPSVSEDIAKTALRIVEVGKIVDESLQKAVDYCSYTKEDRVGDKILYIEVNKLFNTSSPEYTLHTILSPLGFRPSQVEDIASSDLSHAGKRWESQSHVIVVDRECLLIRQRKSIDNKVVIIPEVGNYVISESDSNKETIHVSVEECGDDFHVDKSPLCACLDASKVLFPLTLRHYRQGERFVPFGMKGSKLINDYLTDRKRNLFEKESQFVLCDSNDNVVWLVGERPDGRYCIGKNTIKSLIIRYKFNG